MLMKERMGGKDVFICPLPQRGRWKRRRRGGEVETGMGSGGNKHIFMYGFCHPRSHQAAEAPRDLINSRERSQSFFFSHQHTWLGNDFHII